MSRRRPALNSKPPIGFDDKKGGYSSGSKPVSKLPKIPLRDRATSVTR
jgi:hypothetical protein